MVKEKRIIKNSIVITFDDGFDATFNEMIPFLLEEKIPVTNYITTYKSINEGPIFRLILRYVFWKTKQARLELTPEIRQILQGFEAKEISTKDRVLYWPLIAFCEKNLFHQERKDLVFLVAKILKVELSQQLISSLSIAPLDKLKEFAKRGLDIQLHTHDHHISDDDEEFIKDLKQNIEILSALSDTPLKHFCYPSGMWKKEDFKILIQHDIKTATTYDLGLLGQDTHLLKIPRIIDSESIKLCSFHGEIVGLGCFLRALKSKFKSGPPTPELSET